MSNSALANIDAAKKMLAEAKDLTATLEIRDMAVAAQAYATAKGADEASQIAIEIKLRSERKAGFYIKDMKEQGIIKQGGDQKSNRHRVSLKTYGVEAYESARWQKIADIPEERFEEYLTKSKKRTQNALLVEARNIAHSENIKNIKREIPFVVPPDGPFDVIVIDPPWDYGNKYDQQNNRGTAPYPTMSLDEIKQIKLPMKDNCIVWLWTTTGFLHEAFHVLESWDLTYKSCLTWEKDKMGLGRWLRTKTEHCLLATKGTPTKQLTNQTTIFHGVRREHSVKPTEFYDLVDTYCFGSKVDWFARTERPGWATFGTLEGHGA